MSGGQSEIVLESGISVVYLKIAVILTRSKQQKNKTRSTKVTSTEMSKTTTLPVEQHVKVKL